MTTSRLEPGAARGGAVLLPFTRPIRGRLLRARLAAALAACLLAVVVPAPAPAEAVSSPHGIDEVSVSTRRGFVHGTAWFRDTGSGQSWVHAWIETYSRATGEITGSLAHRSGVASCQRGATCYVLLVTSAQAHGGECYVLRAVSSRGASLVQAQAPEGGKLCR